MYRAWEMKTLWPTTRSTVAPPRLQAALGSALGLRSLFRRWATAAGLPTALARRRNHGYLGTPGNILASKASLKGPTVAPSRRAWCPWGWGPSPAQAGRVARPSWVALGRFRWLGDTGGRACPILVFSRFVPKLETEAENGKSATEKV